MSSYSCLDSGHVWEVTETYQQDRNTLAVVRKCFECDEEFTEYEVLEDE